MVRSIFPEIKLIANTDNVGFAKANNQAVAEAKGEYICILNPDTVVAEDTFEKLIRKIEHLPYAGLLGIRLIDGTGKFLPESKRNIPSPLTAFRRLFGVRLGNVKSYYADHIHMYGNGDVQVLVGAFMFGKRIQYEEVEGFDEAYFMYGEDIDLSYKMLKAGYHNYYIGDMAAIHYKGESTSKNKEYLERFYGAMQLFYKKHFKSNKLFDSFIYLGIRMVSFVKSKMPVKKKIKKIAHYYVITDEASLATRLEKVLQHPIQQLKDVSDLVYKSKEAKQIVLDNNYLSYGEIIGIMQQLASKQTTFKIKPKHCNFVIGSNYSDEKGEVITL